MSLGRRALFLLRPPIVLCGLGLGSLMPAAAAPAAKGPATILPGTSSHDPINIEAGKLDYFDKEQKLIYSGNVVAVQGDSTLKASQLTIYLVKTDAKGAAPAGGETAAAAAAAAPPAAGPSGGSSVKHMDAAGPVTLVSKDQIGTGDSGTYDKDENKVTLTGNVTLSQGPNVTRGDRLIYDLTSGQAQVYSGRTNNGRVISVFTPNSTPPGDASASSAPSGKKPPAPAKKKSGGGTASRQ